MGCWALDVGFGSKTPAPVFLMCAQLRRRFSSIPFLCLHLKDHMWSGIQKEKVKRVQLCNCLYQCKNCFFHQTASSSKNVFVLLLMFYHYFNLLPGHVYVADFLFFSSHLFRFLVDLMKTETWGDLFRGLDFTSFIAIRVYFRMIRKLIEKISLRIIQIFTPRHLVPSV